MRPLSDFAGPYGPFVWPAYACAALIFVWMILGTMRLARRARGEAARREESRGDGP
jgi:heme exporter protein CcmD